MKKFLLFSIIGLFAFATQAQAITLTSQELGELLQGGQSSMLGATYLFPSGGGTGTSTNPTYGQMLVGNAGGTYTLTATSTLGIGTVTSVGLSVPTGLTVANSPVTTSGTLAVTFTAGYSIPTTALQNTWSNKWDYESSTIPVAKTLLTGGAGLTLTVDDLACDTASGSVFGCLSAANWNTFNNKWDLSSSTIGAIYGGTSQSTYTAGDILYASAANTLAKLPATTNGYILALSAGLPAWVATSSTGTVNSGTTGQFPYYAGNGTTLTATSTPFLATTGKLGVNNATPEARLDVGGAIRSTGNTTLSTGKGLTVYYDTTNDFGVIDSYDQDGIAQKPIRFNNNFFVINYDVSGGKVGVASTTPWGLLSVEQGTETNSFVVSNTGSSTPSFVVRGVNGNGNVGIASSTPAYRLSVNSGSSAFAVNDSGIVIQGGWNGTVIDEAYIDWIVTGQVIDFGGATSTEMPNGSAPTVNATGEFALDTTSNQFKIYNGSSTDIYSPTRYISFSFPSGAATATTTAATTTIEIGPAFVGETFSAITCRSGAGTVGYELSDATNKMNFLQATTTPSKFGLTTNNTFIADERRVVNIGPMTASYLSCTAAKTITEN